MNFTSIEKTFYGRVLYLIIAFLLINSTLLAQSERKAIRQGKKLIEYGFYLKALNKFNSIIKPDSSFSEVNLLASICYLELHEPTNALRLINRISYDDDCINFYKAVCYYYLEKFDDARKLLRSVNEISCYHRYTKDELDSLIKNAALSYGASKGFLVRNFGNNINSKYREYCAVMLNKFDSVLFTSRRTESHNKIAEDGMGYESIYITSVNKDQSWISASKFNLDIQSNRNHNATSQVVNEGKEVIIFRNGDLYLAKKVKDRWIEQRKLSAINTGYNETHCFVTPDQNTIYFSSDYLSDDNNLDLFETTKNSDGLWSEPEAIEELNTPYDEDAPFISEDGIFYFSSRGHNSIGGFDVFATRFDKKTGNWEPIKNLGHPINTVADDIYFTTYGKLGYISSSRLGGEGMLDLYQVLLFNKVKMQGKIINSVDNLPITGATIDLNYGQWFLRGYSDYEGNYEMYVPINKNMQFSVQKDSIHLHTGNYLVNVYFGNENDNLYNFTVDLAHLPDEGPALSANFISLSDTVTIDLKVKNDLKRNELIRGISGDKEKQWIDSLNALFNDRYIIDSLFVKYQKSNKELPLETVLAIVHFEFDKFELKDSVKLLLSNCIDNLTRDEYNQLQICGYTDAVGSDAYNQILSIKRAQAVSKFLIDQGISMDKMIVKGLGERDLLEYHDGKSATNRRVELILRRSINAHNPKGNQFLSFEDD